MTELQARKIYLGAVNKAQAASRKALDQRRTNDNRIKAFLQYRGLAHAQKVFYTEWMTHFSTAELSKTGVTKLSKTLSELT